MSSVGANVIYYPTYSHIRTQARTHARTSQLTVKFKHLMMSLLGYSAI